MILRLKDSMLIDIPSGPTYQIKRGIFKPYYRYGNIYFQIQVFENVFLGELLGSEGSGSILNRFLGMTSQSVHGYDEAMPSVSSFIATIAMASPMQWWCRILSVSPNISDWISAYQ